MIRQQQLAGLPHDLAQFLVGRLHGLYVQKLEAASRRLKATCIRIELKSREIDPSVLDRQLTHTIIDRANACLLRTLEHLGDRRPSLDRFKGVFVEFDFGQTPWRVTVNIVDGKGRSHRHTAELAAR